MKTTYIVYSIIILYLLIFPYKSSAADNSLWDAPLKKGNSLYIRTLRDIEIKNAVTKTFVQSKNIKALNRNLISKGVLFISQKGVCWQIVSPVFSSMLLTEHGITQKGQGGKVETKSTGHDMRTRYIVKIMMAMFMAQKEVLEAEFDLYFVKNRDSWQLGLVPKKRVMKRAVRHIVIAGTHGVDSISILQAQGDLTVIKISDSSSTEVTLKNCVK